MDKDNEMYVTSNGELYKKGVEQAIYPQTNYTTQQFYTKEEYDKLQAEYDDLHLTYAGCKTANAGLQELNQKLQAENDNLKDDIDKQQLYVDSLEQENERLKSALAIWENATLKQTALKVVEVDKYRQALQEIKEILQ